MKNKIFGDMIFNSGWEKHIVILFKKQKYEIVVNAEAFYEKDRITREQEDAYSSFLKNEDELLGKVEDKINTINNCERFIPTLLLIKRNGEYGLIFDDKSDIEGGVVVGIKPEIELLSTDQYF